MKKSFLFVALCIISAQLCAGHIVPEKILICGVCKDIEFAVGTSIRNIEKLGKRYQDYTAIIYENNSNDMTPHLLADWASRNPHVLLVSETLKSSELPGSREEKIARARNIVLDLARDAKFDEYTHLIMVDLDFAHSWPIDEIVATTQLQGDWHCISANGVKNGSYWDRYAYRDSQYPFGPELLGLDWWNQLFRSWFDLKGDKPKRVYSAFGGLAVYKRSALIPFHYSGTVTVDLQNYYELILADLPTHCPQLQEYLKINHVSYNNIFQQPLIFQSSPPSNQPEGYHRLICCEHVTLHASMALHGFGNFFINPKLIMKY